MIGWVFKFLSVIIQAGLGIIAILLLIYVMVWIMNRVVQFVADQLGYEVGDFFEWLGKKLPKKKKKDILD